MGLPAEATGEVESSLGVLDSRPDFVDWVAASRTRNWCRRDLVLDWLDLYGAAAGFTSDDKLPGYDRSLNFQHYLLEQGRAFEHAVIEKLSSRWPVTVIGSNPAHARSLAKARATSQAMLDGKPLIFQAVLWNEDARMFGMVDLLARSDVLYEFCPGAFAEEGPAAHRHPAPKLGNPAWHYRAADIKFMTLQFRRSGEPSREHSTGMVQCWIYNQALGSLQGYTPAASYLLGRGWLQGDQRGTSCFDRLARVPDGDGILQDHVRQAAEWYRMVRREGGSWQVLPCPTRPELYPNMKDTEDFPWEHAKETIGMELADPTLLWRVGWRRRAIGHAAGITRWDDPSLSAATLGFSDDTQGRTLDAILAANRRPQTPGVSPARILSNDGDWREPAPLEFYVDFETVSDLGDDFSHIPEKGGAPRIFMIGCGRLDSAGNWQFAPFTARDLSFEAERNLIDRWIAYLHSAAAEADVQLSEARLFHWSPAETSILQDAYNSAQARHTERHWPELNWFDLLQRLARREPVTVTGAFNFGLKSFAKALFALGLIQTSWPDSRIDGLAAMIAAWRAAEEASERGIAMTDTELMQEIGRYNEVDCKVMMEVLRYLRLNH